MSSLKERIERLENDLKAVPSRISVYHDLPFAILRYDASDEWLLRREVKLLATRLEDKGKEVHEIPMSELLWSALDKVHEKDDDEGLDAVVALEKDRGYETAQRQITTYLSSKVWTPLCDLLADRLASISPNNAVVFLTRVAAMSPALFHMSMLLDQMHGRSRVTTILFYPGAIEGTTGLRFMDLKDRDALGNYRVKIYG
ncbi:MAG TPA: BREX protein BrxB domain-containing protein [Pirellulales bacterium]|nr:BREX protein BrxB domain-containing protein [Pirellulales bacterium]